MNNTSIKSNLVKPISRFVLRRPARIGTVYQETETKFIVDVLQLVPEHFTTSHPLTAFLHIDDMCDELEFHKFYVKAYGVSLYFPDYENSSMEWASYVFSAMPEDLSGVTA